jgi:hypothetical protein
MEQRITTPLIKSVTENRKFLETIPLILGMVPRNSPPFLNKAWDRPRNYFHLGLWAGWVFTRKITWAQYTYLTYVVRLGLKSSTVQQEAPIS